MYIDNDLDGAFEVTKYRDRAGRFETFQFDADADGVYERSATGELSLAMKRWERFDHNEDGIYEERSEPSQPAHRDSLNPPT